MVMGIAIRPPRLDSFRGFGSVTTASSINKAVGLRSKQVREQPAAGRRLRSRSGGTGCRAVGLRSRQEREQSRRPLFRLEQGTTPLRNTLLYRKNVCYGARPPVARPYAKEPKRALPRSGETGDCHGYRRPGRRRGKHNWSAGRHHRMLRVASATKPTDRRRNLRPR